MEQLINFRNLLLCTVTEMREITWESNIQIKKRELVHSGYHLIDLLLLNLYLARPTMSKF